MMAVRDYVKASIQALVAKGDSIQSFKDFGSEWKRVNNNFWLRKASNAVDWTVSFLRLAGELHKLPEYQKALEAMMNDSVIKPQLDQMVGTNFAKTRIGKERIVDTITIQTVRGRSLEFHQAPFREAYLREEASLYSRTVTMVYIAPLFGIVDAPRVRLGSIEIDRMTDGEAQILLDFGALQSYRSMGEAAHAATEYVLRLRHEMPKVVGDDARAVISIPRTRELFFDAVRTLRLFKRFPVSIPGIVSYSEPQSLGYSWGPLDSRMIVHNPTYTLSRSEGAQVSRLWRSLNSDGVRRRAFLETAVWRFFYAGERERTEDRFIDLMIAAEAMFLAENRKGEAPGELTHKLSMRFAHFSKAPGTSKRQRFDFMKRAYGARSGIVHGDRPKGLATAKDLADFTDKTDDLLRFSLLKMVKLAQANPRRKPLTDWDDLILGAQQQGASS